MKTPPFVPKTHRAFLFAGAGLPLAVSVFSGLLLAHADLGGGGLLSGMKHPVSGLDHVIAMLAVGFWGAQLGLPAMWILPVTFPLIMACGGFLGLMGVPLPGVEIGIALSALVLGALVLGEVRPPLWVAVVVVGFFAVFHGYAHGAELPQGSSALLYSIGFVVATGLLHAGGIGMGTLHGLPFGRYVLRGAGAVVALGGVYFLWNALA